MKKICLFLVLLALVALVCEIHGFSRGFRQGEKETNGWWVDKKSTYYDTSELFKKQLADRYNVI